MFKLSVSRFTYFVKNFLSELYCSGGKEENVDYLTVKKLAELKGCSERYVQRLIKSNKIVAEERINHSSGNFNLKQLVQHQNG